MSLPPSPYEWRSVSYAATFFARSITTIQHWCSDGTFFAASVPTYKDGSGRWWIALPPAASLCIPAADRLHSPTA